MTLEVGMEGKEYKRDLICEMLRTHDERGRVLPARGRLILSVEDIEQLRAVTRGMDKITSKYFKRTQIHLKAWASWQGALVVGLSQATGADGGRLLNNAQLRKITDDLLLSMTLKLVQCAYGLGEGTEEYLLDFPPADSLAQGMAEDILRESSYEFMPVLADCLEDSLEGGSAAPPKMVLDHLRSGRHGPCCWVLRWVLGVDRWREVCRGSER